MSIDNHDMIYKSYTFYIYYKQTDDNKSIDSYKRVAYSKFSSR